MNGQYEEKVLLESIADLYLKIKRVENEMEQIKEQLFVMQEVLSNSVVLKRDRQQE